MSNKSKLRGKPAPEKYRHLVIQEFDVKFSVLERLRILFGYRAHVEFRVACRNHPGATEAGMILTTTHEIKEATL